MLAPVRVTAPAASPVSLSEVKAHCQVSGSASDTVLQVMLDAAVAYLDGWSGILGRCLINQVWRMDLCEWPASRIIRLPFPNVSAATVKYFDADNVEQTVDGSLHAVLHDARGSYVRLSDSFTSPGLHDDRADAVQVTFTAGYGSAGTDVPAAIRAAILLSVQSMFSMQQAGNVLVRSEEVEGIGRVDYAVSDQAGVVIERAVAALVAPYRRVGV